MDLHEIRMKHHWRLNPEQKIVIDILAKENEYFERYGFYYCPSKICKCPCDEAQHEIDTEGHCQGMLFCGSSHISITLTYNIRFNERDIVVFSDNDLLELTFYQSKIGTNDIVIWYDRKTTHLFRYKEQWYITNKPDISITDLEQIDNGEPDQTIWNISNVFIKMNPINIKGVLIKKNVGWYATQLSGLFYEYGVN